MPEPSDRQHFSHSQLGMLRRCEQQWCYRYALGIKRPPSAAMTIGSAFNDGITYNLARKIDSGVDLPTSEVVEVAVTGLENRHDSTEWDEPFDAVKDEMPGLVTVFQEEAAPDIHPVAVEEEIRVGFKGEDWDLLSYIDVREDDGTVRDFKTARKRWAKGRELTEAQPVIYTATEPGDSVFKFDVTVRNKKPIVDTRTRIVTEDEKRATLALVALAKRRGDEIKADPDKAWPTGYGGNLCSKRYCGYWEMCAKRWKHPIRD